MTTYIKLGENGTELPDDAEGHTAVRVSHPLLASPLIVTAHHAPKTMIWKQAKAWAEKLDLNGWIWRLPTAEEAMFIPDRSKYPAVNPKYFPDFRDYEWIWTSTSDAESPAGCAWVVYLRYGYVYRGGQPTHGYVRAVRSGQ